MFSGWPSIFSQRLRASSYCFSSTNWSTCACQMWNCDLVTNLFYNVNWNKAPNKGLWCNIDITLRCDKFTGACRNCLNLSVVNYEAQQEKNAPPQEKYLRACIPLTGFRIQFWLPEADQPKQLYMDKSSLKHVRNNKTFWQCLPKATGGSLQLKPYFRVGFPSNPTNILIAAQR